MKQPAGSFMDFVSKLTFDAGRTIEMFSFMSCVLTLFENVGLREKAKKMSLMKIPAITSCQA